MGTPRLNSKPGIRILPIVFPVIVFLVFFHADANGFYEKRTFNTASFSIIELEIAIRECQNQTQILNKQIQDIQKDLDWLILKINRIADSGRKVPQALKLSVISKEKRIAQLIDEKARLDKNLAGYQKGYQAKAREAASKYPISKSTSNKSIVTVENVPDASIAQGKISHIAMAIKKAGLEDWVEVLNADGGGVKITTALPILFPSGSAALSKEYKPFLKKLASFLKSYDVKIYVNGFTDPDPIRTIKYPSNLELGASRAANIVHEMVKYGLKPGIFKIGSTGEYRFVAKLPSSKKSFQRTAKVTVIFTG